MEKQTIETIGQYFASIVIGLYAFIKGVQKGYNALKDFFIKKEQKQESKVTVNVGSTITPSSDFKASKEDYRYFLYFLLEQGKINKAMHDLKSDVLKEQMEYFFKHVQNMKLVYNSIIIDLLKDAGIDDIHFGTYFSNFENFMEVCESKITTLYRRMCKDNHFIEYSQQEYKDLVDRNINILEGSLSELLRKRYPQREFIKNFQKIYETRILMLNGFKDCFEQARDIALEKSQKVLLAKCNFEKRVSEIIGEPFSLEI